MTGWLLLTEIYMLREGDSIVIASEVVTVAYLSEDQASFNNHSHTNGIAVQGLVPGSDVMILEVSNFSAQRAYYVDDIYNLEFDILMQGGYLLIDVHK